MVEHEGHQLDRRASEPREHALPLVGVGEQATGLFVAQRPQQRQPPVVGEVLGLVDDDRVEPFRVGQADGPLGHEARQLDLPERRVVTGAEVGEAPAASQVFEGAHERGPL